MRSLKFLLLLLALLSPANQVLFAQPATKLPFPLLGQIARRSGYIFAGTVMAVERIADRGAAVDSVRITFRVDRGIRGVRTGQSLTIREWAGLWASGERYQPGQRVMLFLYRPSKLGFTSAVGGAQGRLDVSQDGRVILQPDWQAGPSEEFRTKPKKARLSAREFARALRSPEE